MSGELEKFKAAIGAGVRPNQFKVVFNTPTALVGAGATGETLSYLVKAASLPGRAIQEVEVPWLGQRAYLAGDANYQPWTVTFYNDVSFGAFATMYSWQEMCRSTLANGASNPGVYKTNLIEVHQLDQNRNVIHKVGLVGAWPTELMELQLDQTQESTIEEFQCTFRYDYWVVLPLA